MLNVKTFIPLEAKAVKNIENWEIQIIIIIIHLYHKIQATSLSVSKVFQCPVLQQFNLHKKRIERDFVVI